MISRKDLEQHLDPRETILGMFSGTLMSSFVPSRPGSSSDSPLAQGGSCVSLVVTNHRLLLVAVEDRGGGLLGGPRYQFRYCLSTALNGIRAFSSVRNKESGYVAPNTTAFVAHAEIFLPSGIRCRFTIE